MTAAERQRLALSASLHVETARKDLDKALSEMCALCDDIGIDHHARRAIELALSDCKVADVVMQQLVADIYKIKEPSHVARTEASHLVVPRKR